MHLLVSLLITVYWIHRIVIRYKELLVCKDVDSDWNRSEYGLPDVFVDTIVNLWVL